MSGFINGVGIAPHDARGNTLVSEDIKGLLELGAPRDEYSHEAEAIALELNALPSASGSMEDRVADIIANVCAKSVELSQEDVEKRSPALRRVALEILASYAKRTKRI